jgi:hypothetical protein
LEVHTLTEKTITEKYCNRCNQTKPIDSFGNWKLGKDGKQLYCKECTNKQGRGYYDTNPRVIECRRVAIERSKERKLKSAERPQWVNYYLTRTYGITVHDYDAMLAAQKNVCAICLQTSKGTKRKRLHVDHDHQTGAIRGLLCVSCNIILGRWNDSPEIARRAVEYLLKPRQLKLA